MSVESDRVRVLLCFVYFSYCWTESTYCWMQFDLDDAAPPEHAWRRRLNSHANILKEFSVTFREAIKMVCSLWNYGLAVYDA